MEKVAEKSVYVFNCPPYNLKSSWIYLSRGYGSWLVKFIDRCGKTKNFKIVICNMFLPGNIKLSCIGRPSIIPRVTFAIPIKEVIKKHIGGFETSRYKRMMHTDKLSDICNSDSWIRVQGARWMDTKDDDMAPHPP